MRSPRAFAPSLLISVVAACQPGGEPDYATLYRPSQLERAATASLLDATPAEVAAARARDRAVYEAELQRQMMLAGSLSAQQAARGGARLDRQAQTLSRAQRDLVWAERNAAREMRELRTAERLDRRAVGTDPTDRADALRRMEALEARRALDRQQRAARVAARAADRLDRLGAIESAAERIRVMDRIERREAERERAARQGPPDPLQRYLPYRRPGESVDSLRARVEAAEAQSAATGRPVASILRE